MRRPWRTAAAAAVLAWSVLGSAAAAMADPALFVARAPGLTAYLFGSIHALPPGLDWEKPALTAAFRAASECWFELRLSDMPPGTNVWARGIDPTHRLPALLSGAEHAQLRQRVADLDLPGGPTAIDRMRPWMVYLLVSIGDTRRAEVESSNGVDTVLQARALKNGKRVMPLETADDQVDVFARQPDGLALKLLREALAAPPVAPGPAMDDLVRHWLAGDEAWLAEFADGLGRRLGPAFAQALLRDRNRAWAEKLSALRTAGHGRARTILVTVGAAHLVGTDSLVEQLESRGFTVERIQP